MTTSERSLATILFTDIVGSTERATELGDRKWRQLLEEHHARVRRELRRFGGRELNISGGHRRRPDAGGSDRPSGATARHARQARRRAHPGVLAAAAVFEDLLPPELERVGVILPGGNVVPTMLARILVNPERS